MSNTSFGNISLMLNKTIKLLEYNVGNNKINLLELSSAKKQVYHDLQKEFTDVSLDIVDEIFNRLFLPNYSFNKNITFDNGANSFREYEDKYPDIQVPKKYQELNNHFYKLLNLPQPAQRSKEWYDYRYNRITASDAAAAIDLNPYEPVESFILKKCDPNFPFRDNDTVFHGKKYEPTATMIYEHIYNTRVFEFGALPSDKFTFLGASPDGISSKYTLDNKFSDRLGTMLEIKCPVTRDIQTSGKIMGEICPFYYYCQVQQQLACCDLNTCDFWQCKLSEYSSRDEYLADDCHSCINTVGNSGQQINVDNRLKKGIILELYPKNFVPEFEDDKIEWKSKYIIPKRLDMNESQYEAWVIKMLDQYKTLYPDISKDYYFYRIIYWKLESSHNVSITRDDKFLANMVPILQDTWNKILYYRQNQDKLDELKKIVEARKKYIKFNTNYSIHNDQVVKNKILFLDLSADIKSIIKKPESTYNKTSKYNNSTKNNSTKTDIDKKPKAKDVDYDSDYCDFIDNDECDFIDDTPSTNLNTNNSTNSKPSLLQKIIDSKKSSNDYIRKYNKPIAQKTITQFKKLKTINYDNDNNDNNDNCDFID
jgi:putative phage-type endonuclease